MCPGVMDTWRGQIDDYPDLDAKNGECPLCGYTF
jgi:hypothetical protein